MANPLPPALLLLLAAPSPAGVAVDQPATPHDTPRAGDHWEIAQFLIRQRIVIRAQQAPQSRMPIPVPPLPKLNVEEKKGPKCVPIDQLSGSGVARKDSVDLLMSDGTMLRAKLDDDCPALEFYAGMYLKRTPDGMLCGKRDVIRARSGRACPIAAFKKLKPKK